MKNFSGRFTEAYTSLLDTLLCCSPLGSCLEDRRRSTDSTGSLFGLSHLSQVTNARIEKGSVVFSDQPRSTPPPVLPAFGSEKKMARGYSEEQAPRMRAKGYGRGLFSARRRLWNRSSSTRRPQISAPSNFRHIHSESFQFPQRSHQSPQPRGRPSSFRPIELSIYMPTRRLSPILPHFEYPDRTITPPPLARTQGSFDSDGITLAHERSYSSMSFHLPRRPVPQSSPSQSTDETPPRIPPRSRLRAYTSPSVDKIYERIASAIIERDRLQDEIDSVIERQSIYASSRPSTAHGLGDLEPMPSIPAFPAAAPSFAERLSTDRPNTAPPMPNTGMPSHEGPAVDDETAFPAPLRQARAPKAPSRVNGMPVDIPLAPPLPLVLRPPLRKKKSFSRVSHWLFPVEEGGQHQRDNSFGSITNLPKPVTGNEGFYQCIAPSQLAERASFDTMSTISTWTTEEDPALPSTWSPGSSPVTKQETPTSAVGRMPVFGGGNTRHITPSVGVAF